MNRKDQERNFVTKGRIALATNYARELAEREPCWSAAACAEKAVRRIFGRWLEDPTAAIRSTYLPLYWRLVSKVESDMGVHRATKPMSAPSHPWPMRSSVAVPAALGA